MIDYSLANINLINAPARKLFIRTDAFGCMQVSTNLVGFLPSTRIRARSWQV